MSDPIWDKFPDYDRVLSPLSKRELRELDRRLYHAWRNADHAAEWHGPGTSWDGIREDLGGVVSDIALELICR